MGTVGPTLTTVSGDHASSQRGQQARSPFTVYPEEIEMRLDYIVATTVILLGSTISAFGVETKDAECKPVGSWTCLAHERGMCVRTFNQFGSSCGLGLAICEICTGATTYPEKMCFYKENASCTNVLPVDCGPRQLSTCEPNPYGDGCFCRHYANPIEVGSCQFSSC
jgi:hypothetical protein